MYDKRKKQAITGQSGRARVRAAASAGWIIMLLAISLLVAWVELGEDSRDQGVFPVESACLHPRVCVG